MALMFNALTGPELKVAILADIAQKLDNTGEFQGNITFPWVKYEYTVGLVIYPRQDVDAEPGVKVSGSFEAPEAPPASPIVVVAVADSKIVDTPDLTRIASGQPVPATQPGPGGVLVDKSVKVQPPALPQRKGTFQKKAEVTSGTGNV